MKSSQTNRHLATLDIKGEGEEQMHIYIKTLTKVASRYAPSRILTFESVHIFKVLQLIQRRGHISRAIICNELSLGDGSARTLLKHLNMEGIVESTNAGTTFTERGKTFASRLLPLIHAETSIPKCSVALGKYNHAVLVKEFSFAVKSGIEQRDAAIKMGATGATTLLYKDHKFVMPGTKDNVLNNENDTAKLLFNNLKPMEGDVIIIGSDSDNKKIAELAAKSAAIATILDHEKHNYM
jgi:ribosomal protein S25